MTDMGAKVVNLTTVQADRMSDFRNRVKLMHFIDLHDIVGAGIEMTAREWASFRDNPFQWFTRAQEADQRKLWLIIERESNRGR
jgi:hypothetical protein